MKKLDIKQMSETKGGFIWAIFAIAVLTGAIIGFMLSDQDGQID